MVKVVGADSGSADGTGEVASSAALDAASAVYADGQPPIKPLPARVGPVSDMTVSRPQSCKHALRGDTSDLNPTPLTHPYRELAVDSTSCPTSGFQPMIAVRLNAKSSAAVAEPQG